MTHLTFERYSSQAVGDPEVLWDVVTSEYGSLKDTIRSAGFDPDDRDTKVGILEVAWNGHPAGALVVSSRSRKLGRPLLVSREPLV
jgi:hypothetical protein